MHIETDFEIFLSITVHTGIRIGGRGAAPHILVTVSSLQLA